MFIEMLKKVIRLLILFAVGLIAVLSLGYIGTR